jgi:alkanesulfonate monooxygenase SsuD/methylene tetrahydromethanopterin reductase-like flavin-dependent oxidoreductase (luciferase family)
LYNPSFGIGKDKVPAFGGETAILIPRPEKFDPKTSNTVLTALDSFSPRYRDAAGERVDALRSQIRPDVAPNFQTSWNADLAKGRAANDRLWDRFISINPMGGIGGEGMSGKVVPGIMELPKYGSGANPKLIAEALRRQTEALNRIDPLHRMSIGPRHQSYEAFNESPYGANRINSTSPKNRPMESVYEDLNKFIDAHFSAEHDFTQRQKYKALVDAAGAKGEAPEVRAEAQSIIRDLRTMHSAYGELKAFGPVGLNKENFAGIILPPTTSDADYKVATALRESAKERGLRVTNEPDLSSGFMDQQEKEGQMAEMVRWLLKAPRK